MTAIWTAIEFAPKDGTLVDLWVTDGKEQYRQTDCRWNSSLSTWVAVDDDGWETSLELYAIYPTNYMPIPAGPNT